MFSVQMLFTLFIYISGEPNIKSDLLQVPQTTYTTPSVNTKLEEVRSKNRKKAEVLSVYIQALCTFPFWQQNSTLLHSFFFSFLQSNLHTANASQFQCANPQKSDKTQRKMYEIQVEKESKYVLAHLIFFVSI